jgi:hypothetical protein
MDYTEGFVPVKLTFNKAAKPRPSFGLPKSPQSTSIEERKTEERRPPELDMEQIMQSNHAIEAFLSNIPVQSRSPSNGPASATSSALRNLVLPMLSTSSKAEMEQSLRFTVPEAVLPAVGLSSDDDFDVMCLNCFEFLTCSQADSHSSACYKTLTLCRNKEFGVRLESLKALAAERAQRSEDTFYAELMDVTRDIQSSHEERLVERVTKLCDKADSLAALLLAKRLVHLITEYSGKSLPSHLTSDDLQAFTAFEANKACLRMSRWKEHADLAEAFQIEEVSSEFEDEMNESLVGFSLYTSFLEDSLPIGQSNVKQSFYSECLKIKARLPKEHPAHHVLISSLYLCSIKERVGLEQWQSYIKASLGVVD